ncbi:MAG: tRNA (adenosine(37)-N6)-dimethylallyltransferase MiaA, partial [Candidatus Shapirobacteria bacterium]|nr:tRNA (adenosine(37)-N6)-dimethylallyltransferase MiaA [Candidatus Shapirobacteria bacterium]
MKKLLVICGPTATGKTSLGLHLAKKFNGEIISADSRQVYKGMDIATGKDVKNGEWMMDNRALGHWEIEGIPFWLLDAVEPNEEFSAAHFTDLAWEKIKNIWQRKKLPILVGGTGLYIKTIIEDVPSKGISPNWPLRKQLELKSIDSLFEELAELDSFRAGQMNSSDRQNKRRLVRAIEVTRWRMANRLQETKKSPQFDSLLIGLSTSLKTLYQKIDKRVDEHLQMGAENEMKKLLEKGFSWKLSSMSAMGYQEWQPYFEGKAKIEKTDGLNGLTFRKKDGKIRWKKKFLSGTLKVMPKKIEISHRTIIFTVFFLLFLWLLYFLRGVLIIFFFSIILMAAFNPLVDRLQRWRIPRALSIILIYILIFGA